MEAKLMFGVTCLGGVVHRRITLHSPPPLMFGGLHLSWSKVRCPNLQQVIALLNKSRFYSVQSFLNLFLSDHPEKLALYHIYKDDNFC
ncbi:hypothetical protein CDAR_293331 [Caerostris darwini]|uniref:Uncharacterized protein n=1 Tax=Caerostris darwini TaxID=1538125 RepID=A0AAV4QJ86_9ARAC|nr:hypothetical protein CDAR_293331 [Caerostris darwini]